MKESTNIFIPRDTAALSMGSDEVAIKIKETAEKSNISISIINKFVFQMVPYLKHGNKWIYTKFKR